MFCSILECFLSGLVRFSVFLVGFVLVRVRVRARLGLGLGLG